MLKRKKLIILLSGALVFIFMFSVIPSSSKTTYSESYKESHILEHPHRSGTLEGSENILMISIYREVELSIYGAVNIIDEIIFKNEDTNPIDSIYIGIPLAHTDDLVFYEATGEQENTLLAERTDLVMREYEMIAIYFETPLLPQQQQEVKFVQTYKDLLIYEKEDFVPQYINFTYAPFPVTPYKADGIIKAVYNLPGSSQIQFKQDWVREVGKTIIYDDLTKLEPFLEDLVAVGKDEIRIVLSDDSATKFEVKEINREIYINAFGTIKVKEEFTVKNNGPESDVDEISIDALAFEIPGPAKQIRVFDDLGDILGVEVDPEENYFNLTYKDLEIDLSENRVRIDPGTKYTFFIQYFLPFEQYISINWFQESYEMDVLTSIYEYLGKDQTIKIFIEGCLSIDSISESPDAIEHTENSMVIVYVSDYVSPYERKEVQFTFTVNFFDILYRPFILIILIALIASAYVLIIKSKKEEAAIAGLRREELPVMDIREFCSLLEEKNALFLEIRQAEEDVKRKKIIKKKYKNIVNKNTVKIEEVDKELIPFNKIVREIDANFENIVKKIELLEAERASVKDSLNLLEARYKRGRLPSKAAYLKLSDNFLRRQRKIDRSLDRVIQQLRSYLL